MGDIIPPTGKNDKAANPDEIKGHARAEKIDPKRSTTAFLEEFFPGETSKQGSPIKPNTILESIYKKISDTILPPMLDGVMLAPGTAKRTYDFTLAPEEEAQQRFPQPSNFKNAAEYNLVKDLYASMRKAQLEHTPVEKALSVPERARLAACTMFPENDKECQEGRKLTQKFLVGALENNKGKALDSYKPNKEEINLLAKIHSLRANDHDYLHNKDEILHPQGIAGEHHLPTAFNGIGYDEATNSFVPKVFNLQELLEKQTRSVLNGEVQNPLKADERANLALYSQVLRGVLPVGLLAPTQEGIRNNLLMEYIPIYLDRQCNLAALSAGEINAAKNNAQAKYPTVEKMKDPAGKPLLADGDDLYQYLKLNGDIRRLAVEEELIIRIAGTPGFVHEVLPKIAELPKPEKAYLSSFDKQRFANVNVAMPEYEEGHRLSERAFIRTVQGDLKGHAKGPAKDTLAAQIINTRTPDQAALEDRHLAGWQAAGNNWALAYLNMLPDFGNNTNDVLQTLDVQKQAWTKYPDLKHCIYSLQAAIDEPTALTAEPAESNKRIDELQKAAVKLNPRSPAWCGHKKN